MILADIVMKSFWAGIAAIGFGVLFNIPRRVIFQVWALGALGGLIKFSFLTLYDSIVLASFLAATAVGVVSIRLAHMKHTPPLVFYIPSVIPMVPGFFAYKMMLGFIALTSIEDTDIYMHTLMETVNNGAKTAFILASLGIGVAIPMLITRRETVKKLKTVAKDKPIISEKPPFPKDGSS